MAFNFTNEQSTAIKERGGQFLVSAAAGSGKTRVLVERLLRRVEEEHTDIDRFLIITYTRAAAAELRGRIAAALSQRLAEHPEDAFLRRQATLVYQASISTVDAFCAQFLREEGHRLELDHDFRLCEENEAQIILEDVLSDVLEERYRDAQPGSDFALLVDTMSDGRNDSRLVRILLDVRSKIQSHPDPERWLQEQTAVFALEGVTDAGNTPWGAILLEDAKRQADYWAGRLMEAVELCRGDEKLTTGYAPSIQGAMNSFLALSAATGRGWDEARAHINIEFAPFKPVRNCEDPAAQERIKTLWKQCKDRVDKLKKPFADDSAGLLFDMRAVYPAVRGLFTLVKDLEAAFAAEKRRRGVLDFSDLEHLAARLLVGKDGTPTELAERWAQRFDEVMVDEYQDANAIQDALFNALSDSGRKLFLVGDVKQSIYRFRLADPTIFLEKYRTFPMWDKAAEGEARKVLLSRNFRSRPQVLAGCNDLFRSIMSRAFGEMDYTDAEALYPKDTPFPGEEKDYAVELDLLDCSGSGDEDEEGPKPRRDYLEATFVARRVRTLLDERFPVDDGEGGLRQVQAGDIVILLRSPGTVLRDYASALGELDIPWEAEGAGDFFAATEIQVALSLLQIIDNPRQDVPLIAALRSPAFGFSADRLAQIRAGAPWADFYTALTKDEGEDVREFLNWLADLRRRSGDESCDKLLWRLYDETNLLGIFANLDEGETRRSNLLLLAQLARDFEGNGHRGLYGFLTHLRRLEEQGKSPNLPKVGGGGGGVKIMSIHRSKGLEFPVVILAGLDRKMNTMDERAPMLFHPDLGVGPWRLDLERMLEYPPLSRLAVGRKMHWEQAAE
ncbi:MAG: UvrD-helicase domain-containing protein, partial [Oscillospiraceae bacterium]|nr:UvrD-helicase domain-containing protein [Oscillospiraceae bacterium]